MKRVRLLGISKLVTFICLALIGASLIGCQGWWNRSSKSKSILGFASEQSSDDWEHPQAPAGTTSLNPRTRTPANNVASSGNTKSRYNAVSDNERREELSSQRVVLPRDRNKVSKAEANAADIQSSRPPVAELPPSTPPVSQAVAATPPTTDSTPATSPVITASATAPTNSTVETTKPSIPDTGKDQVDTKGALNLLHPEHQAAMRKKIE